MGLKILNKFGLFNSITLKVPCKKVSNKLSSLVDRILRLNSHL